MSESLEQMRSEKKGFRTEDFSGSAERDIIDVLRHEFSMGNTDVVEYMQTNYGILKTYVLPDDVVDAVLLDSDSQDDFEKMCQARLSALIQENAPDVADEIAEFIYGELPRDGYCRPAALWLGTRENVEALYCEEAATLDEYEIGEHLVLSDLGKEGALFVLCTVKCLNKHPLYAA